MLYLPFPGHSICIFFLRPTAQRNTPTFPGCFTNGNGWECVFGFLTVTFLTLLLFEEMLGVYVFKRRYFVRFDTYVKWTLYTLVIVGFGLQGNFDVLKYVCAVSVPCKETERIRDITWSTTYGGGFC